MNDFKKNLFSQGQKLFTQNEFNQAISEVREEIVNMAIQATHMAVAMEREACATLADNCLDIEKLGEQIRNRIPAQRQ